MLSKHQKYIASILTNLSVLGSVALFMLPNIKVLAQNSSQQSVVSKCTDVEIQKRIQQLNKAESSDFNALVACQSKAVPALIKTLDTKDENVRIIIIAALGQIGSKATPAVPFLKNALNDTSRDVRLISIHALARIDPSVKVDIKEVLKDTPIQARHTSKKCPSPGLDLKLTSDCKIGLSKIAEQSRATSTTEIEGRIDNSLNAKRPVMCRIPAIQALLRWKCP